MQSIIAEGSIVAGSVDLRPVSVVIVNFNAGDKLIACVKSVFEYYSAAEVIVVDNASIDNSIGDLNIAFGMDERLRIHKNQQNQGFSAACNIGLSLARFDNILFLNPDAQLQNGAMESLLGVLHSAPKIGMTGPLMTFPDGREQAGGRRLIPTPARALVRIFKLNRFAKWFPGLLVDFNLHQQPLPEKAVEVEAISGACMMVKRAAIEDIGVWDEGYFLHCEDLDWCQRFMEGGWMIMFVPDAVLVHELGWCSRDRKIMVEWHKHKGMTRFYKKFFWHRYPSVLTLLIISAIWLRFALLMTGLQLKRMLKKSRE